MERIDGDANSMSRLSDYLQKAAIDPRRVLTASKKIEALQPSDRAIRLTRRLARKASDTPDKAPAGEKPAHTGRPVSRSTLHYAIEGQPISGAAKTRILRAVNSVLKQKKKGEATLKDLF
jgi:hypothetical protein